MKLKPAREGDEHEFALYSGVDDQSTLGNAESVIWASIRQVCSKAIGEGLASETYGLSKKRDIRAVADNARVYIQQAHEFYCSANPSASNTAPLIYYYSFLNLAKAVCEFRIPRLHRRHECYRHGISWRPSSDWFVNPESERIHVAGRGVWHLLYEAVTERQCRLPNPSALKVRDLFARCPEISSEFERAYAKSPKIVELLSPAICTSADLKSAWIRFSLVREELRDVRVTAPRILSQLKRDHNSYEEVRSLNSAARRFELSVPVTVSAATPLWDQMKDHVRTFNAYAYPDGEEHQYFLPLVGPRMKPLPQILMLYSILFWLGSLVRYDPQSVERLMDSEYWILIDGFMSQSRLWLLELMEWQLYQTQTMLSQCR